MKIMFNIVSGSKNIEANYNKISKKFTDSNASIKPELSDNIYKLDKAIKEKGCKYDIILVIVIAGQMIADTEKFVNAIVSITENLKGSQKLMVFDRDNLLSSDITEYLITYSDKLKYTSGEPRPGNIYSFVFNKSTAVDADAEKLVKQALIKEKEERDSMPEAVGDDDDDDDIPEADDDDNDEDVPQKENKIKGLVSGIMGGLKSKTKASMVKKSNKMNSKNNTDDEEEIEAVPEDNEEEIEAVQEEDSIEEIETVDEEEVEEDDAPPTFDDDDFDEEEEPEPEPESKRSIKKQQMNSPKKQQSKKRVEQELEPEEEEEEPAEPKSKFFGKASLKIPKVNRKDTLSMQTRPRIVFVTGTGRIGQTTLAASLGFSAAQCFCKSLIVDMDIIRRAISCIYADYSNPNSIESMGLISAIRSPHLVENIATEFYDGVYTLGVPITAADNRELIKTVTSTDVQTMLLQSLQKFNFVVVDMPWDYLLANPELISVPADILFCTSNDMMTIISDLNNLTEDAFEKVESYQLLLSKLRFVLNMTQKENKYGNKVINESSFSNVCYDLTDDEMIRTIPVIASIPFLPGIGNQVTYEQPASAYSEAYASYCMNILQSLK